MNDSTKSCNIAVGVAEICVDRCNQAVETGCFVKAGVLVGLVCQVTTLKECVRRFSEVPMSVARASRDWACQIWRCGWCGRLCVSGYV
jgi:hypothetical protein